MGMRAGIDWEAIKILYRQNQLSIRQIADAHGIAPSSLTRRAKKESWPRDLSEVIRVEVQQAMIERAAASEEERHQAAEAAAQRAIDTAQGKRTAIATAQRNKGDAHAGNAHDAHKTPLTRAGTLIEQGVRAAVAEKVGVITKHQALAQRFANLAMSLHHELEHNTERQEEIKRLQVELGPEFADKAAEIERYTSFNARVGQLKALSEAARNIVGMERTAHGLDKEDEGTGVEDALDTLDRMRADMAKRNAPEGASSS